MSVLEWALIRGLDLQIAAGEVPPGWLVLLGLTLFGGAVAVLTWLVVGWWERRRRERSLPEPESLTVAEPWLADRTEEIPAVRRPRPRHRYPVAFHPEPGEGDRMVVIPKTYGGSR